MERHSFFQRAMPKKAGYLKAAIIIVILALVAQPVLAQNANPNVAPPNSMPYGKSYAEWNAEWWKYVLSMPSDGHPLLSETGENCGVGQSGPVFFLMGTTGGPADRDGCVAPTGKSLFFPIVNFFCASPEDDYIDPSLPMTYDELCSWVTDHIDDLQVSIDGAALENLQDYRFPEYFSFTGAIDNPYDVFCARDAPECYEGFHEKGFSDGYWIMLHPLPAGRHTIQFSGHGYVPEWGWDFAVDISYKLTVK